MSETLDRSVRTDEPGMLAQSRWLGSYELTGVLGRGTAGVVYRARDRTTGREVALKTCATTGATIAESLRREIRALRRLSHPGIVKIVDEGISDGIPWLAMELLCGRTVRDWFVQRKDECAANPGAAAVEDALMLIARLCDPLAYIHQHGVVHGDLKPENIHLTMAAAPVLLDFGVHRRAAGVWGREGLEVGGLVLGTDCYMAPEQIWGELIDARADLYALGCLLYEAITGAPPFVGSLMEVFQQHLHRRPEPLSSRVPGIPEWLDVLVMQLLAKRRGDRLGYADLVAARITAHLDGRAMAAPPITRAYVYRPEMVGREGLVTELSAKVEAARAGRGSLTFVIGESGIGKTRLAMEVGTIAVRGDMEVVLGECETTAGESAVLSRTALQPFRPFFANVSDRCREGGAELTSRLLGARGSILAAYEGSLATLAGHESSAALPDVSPEAALERLTRAVCETLEAAASDRPLLLILDDVQWADELSLHVLDVLCSRGLAGVPLAVVATCRAEELRGPLRATTERGGVSVLRLERLGERSVRRMVGHMLALPDPATEFTSALFEHTEGNPFYVSEYVLVAVEQGYLRRDAGGSWRLVPPRDVGHAQYSLPIPRTLQDLVRFRLERLPPSVRRIAELGSTLGLTFEEAQLLHAAGEPDVAVGDAIDELILRQILRRERPGTLSFGHAKIREVTYDALEIDARVDLHARAARAIEACVDPAELPASYGALASHWSRVAAARVDDPTVRTTALAALERAGRHAADANDHQQAVRLFEEAVRLDRRGTAATRVPPARRALWHRCLGDCHFRLGRMREARDELSAALALAGSRVPVGFLPLLGALATGVATQVGRRAMTRGRHASPRVSAVALDEARTYDLLSFVQFLLMERTPSLVSSLRSLNRAERLLPSSALVNSSAMIGTVAGTLLGPRVARRYFTVALEAGRRLGDDLALGRAAEMQGFYLIGQGDWSAASESLQEAIAAFERIGDRPWRDIAVLTFGNLQFMQHRSALEFYEDGRRNGHERGDVQCQAWAALGRAASLLQHGDTQKGLALLDGADDGVSLDRRFEELSDVTSQLDTAGLRALAMYRLGREEAAIGAVRAACALLPQAPLFRYDPLPGYVCIADVSARSWEAASAAGDARERELAQLATVTFRSLRAFSRFIPIARPRAAIIRGLLSWVRGRRRRAHTEWRRAISLATHLAMPYECALAHYEIARHPVRGVPWEHHLEEAACGFAELGTRYELDLVRRVSPIGPIGPTRLPRAADGR